MFVHIVRDGRAVGSSILRRKRDRNIEWFGVKPPGWKKQLDRPPGAQAGWQWRTVLETIRGDADELGLGSRLVEVRYKDLTERPHETLADLFSSLGLGRDRAKYVEPHIDELENRNAGWKDPLNAEDQDALIEEVQKHGGELHPLD